MNISIFDYVEIRPLSRFGLTGNFWTIHIDTLIYTWAAMLILFVLVLVGSFFLKRKINVVALVTEQAVDFFIDLCKESLGKSFKYNYFAFIAAIFFFTLFCCLVGLLPYLKESTKDLNTTLAIAFMSFLFVQYQKIKVKGIRSFFKGFIEPFFVLLPLNIIGEFAKIISMSFRLFGNILGGGVIYLIVLGVVLSYKVLFMSLAIVALVVSFIINKLVDLNKHRNIKIILNTVLGVVFSLAWLQMFFGVFEGFVQAFVVTMLTVTYLAVGIHDENEVAKEGS